MNKLSDLAQASVARASPASKGSHRFIDKLRNDVGLSPKGYGLDCNLNIMRIGVPLLPEEGVLVLLLLAEEGVLFELLLGVLLGVLDWLPGFFLPGTSPT